MKEFEERIAKELGLCPKKAETLIDLANDTFETFTGVPMKLAEARSPAPDLNAYLRRADVEGMLDLKITGCQDRIDRHRKLMADMDPQGSKWMDTARRIGTEINQMGALRVAKQHLKFCEQFELVDKQGAAVLADRTGYAVAVR